MSGMAVSGANGLNFTKMIIKTNTPDKLRGLVAELKRKGMTQIESNVCADWHETAENFVCVDERLMLWAYCSCFTADRMGYINYTKNE